MKEQIDAILFDMGGTLRSTNKPLHQVNKDIIREMKMLLDMDMGELELIQLLQEHSRAYKNWAQKNMLELNEINLWTSWMLPDWPSDQVSRHALGLSQLWRAATVEHVIYPETKEVICALFRSGYRLGLVSNTTSSVETPGILKKLGISGCFDTVVLSCVVGIRKPDPAILLLAAGQMGVHPDRCAYIGDQADRDVSSARKAGFSQAIILFDQRQLKLEQENDPELIPDHMIQNLTDLLEIFPPRSAPQPATIYDASLSSMWGMKNFPTLAEFFEAARRFGFNRIELNHQVTTSMLAEIDLSQYQFSSVHEPCPADVGEDELKARDWLISSTDEACRVEGVRAVKRSIDLASRIGASTIVIHAGHTIPDHDRLEIKLRELLDTGQRDSEEYRSIQARMHAVRVEHETAGFAAVRKSIHELLAHAEPKGICLGLENRYHYLEFPSPDELEVLLGLGNPDQLGFVYDVGHANTLDRLGFYAYEEWLKRFSTRIVITHLHDLIGTRDHYAPGLGIVDFAMIAGYLPAKAVRTVEVNHHNTVEQIKNGLKLLVESGCVSFIA